MLGIIMMHVYVSATEPATIWLLLEKMAMLMGIDAK